MQLSAGANNIILTLNELKTLDTPEYVLILECIGTDRKTACKLGTELSEYPERFNKFLLTVKANAEPLDSEVELLNEGSYKYFVYEMEDADSFEFDDVDDLDLEDMDGEVERGMMNYSSDPDVIAHYKNLPSSIKANE